MNLNCTELKLLGLDKKYHSTKNNNKGFRSSTQGIRKLSLYESTTNRASCNDGNLKRKRVKTQIKMMFLFFIIQMKTELELCKNERHLNSSNEQHRQHQTLTRVFLSVLSGGGGPVSRTSVDSNRKPDKNPYHLIRDRESVTFHKFKAELTMNKSGLLMLLLLLLYVT